MRTSRRVVSRRRGSKGGYSATINTQMGPRTVGEVVNFFYRVSGRHCRQDALVGMLRALGKRVPAQAKIVARYVLDGSGFTMRIKEVAETILAQ